VCEVAGVAPRLRLAAETTSAVLAPVLCTYTAVLVADTAVPVWHEARRELPFVFAGGAAMSAGAAASLVTRHADARAARRLLGLGAATELVATAAMDRRLGPLGQPYREGKAGRYMRAAKALTIGGAALALSPGRRRAGRAGRARLGSGLVLAGAACTRLAVLAAGTQSANDPRATVEPQRRRVASR
jgi:formate-dependent nitrite reductase membrane component NrfD